MRRTLILLSALLVGCSAPHRAVEHEKAVVRSDALPVAMAWIPARVEAAIILGGWQFVAQGGRSLSPRTVAPTSTAIASSNRSCAR